MGEGTRDSKILENLKQDFEVLLHGTVQKKVGKETRELLGKVRPLSTGRTQNSFEKTYQNNY